MDVTSVLQKFDIDPAQGKTRAVQAVGQMISEASDPLGMANAVIVGLGGQDMLSFPEARITAKALIERAVEDKDQFNTDEAIQYAQEKLQRLLKKLPELQVEVEQASKAVESGVVEVVKRGRPETKTKDGGSLKQKALAICGANSDCTNAQLAQMIQKELGITYSNAYYYSSRVFKRK